MELFADRLWVVVDSLLPSSPGKKWEAGNSFWVWEAEFLPYSSSLFSDIQIRNQVLPCSKLEAGIGVLNDRGFPKFF